MNSLKIMIKIQTKNKEDRKTLLNEFLDVLGEHDCFPDTSIHYNNTDDEVNIIAEAK